MRITAPFAVSFFTAFIFIAFTSLVFVVSSQAQEKVVLLSNNYAPLVTPGWKTEGVFTDLVRAAFAEVGVDVELRVEPWTKCAELVASGEALGAIPYIHTDARKKYAWFSDAVWHGKNTFFYLKDRLDVYTFTGVESLKSYKVAVTEGHAGVDWLEDEGVVVERSATEIVGLQKLLDQKVDLFLDAELVGWHLIARNYPTEIHRFRAATTEWRSFTSHLMVSKKFPGSKSLLDRFNQGLKIIIDNGRYDAIVARYKATSAGPIVPMN